MTYSLRAERQGHGSQNQNITSCAEKRVMSKCMSQPAPVDQQKPVDSQSDADDAANAVTEVDLLDETGIHFQTWDT